MLSTEEESKLAWFGHRLESWDAMRNLSVPFAQRREKLVGDLEKELKARTFPDDSDEDLGLLREDINIARFLGENDETLVREICDERTDYYRAWRKVLLKKK